MGELIRTFDWATTPVGKVEGWSYSLRTAISICLESAFPMLICWGTELVQFYNDAYIPILGIKHPQALGQRFRDCWSEVWETLEPIFTSVRETGKAVKSEDTRFIIRRYGYDEETYFSVSYSAIRNEVGQIGGVLCTVSETTQKVLGDRRLRTLRELAVNTTEARTLQAAGQVAINTLTSNRADIPFALLYLLNSQQIAQRLCETGLGASPLNLATVDCRQNIGGWAFAQVMQTGQPQLVSNLRSDGSNALSQPELPNTALILPIAAQTQAGMSGFLVVGISPYLELSSEYRDFLELVAGQVATALTNARAYEEERKRVEALAELDRAKTTFFSNVSHEFRTPLTLMLSPLEETLTELEGIIPAKARSQLEMVQRNGKRLLKLVNTLLDFSRIEARRTVACYEPTDLATYTAELASIFRSAVEQAGLQLSVDCPPMPVPVYVDREMWEKIVLNLLSNAFKFTFEGEIAVSVHQIGEQVELVVRDTGTGIAAEEIPRLFERFHRVAGARGRTFEGTGIGLSLVQELVHLHGGAIAVDSTLGQGSTFTVRLPTGTAHLPLERLKANRTQTSTASGAISYVEEALGWLPEESRGRREAGGVNSSPASPASPASSARILLVDDNADMRDYLQRILSQFYEVEVVADGETALLCVQENTPDLILTDVMMPGIDGFELLRQLRCDPKTRALPILLLSARAGEESAVEGLEAGADDYLVKPFSTRELLARVAANLELGRTRQDAQRKQAEVVLRKSEERLQQAMAIETVGVIFFKIDGSIIDSNNAFLHMSGYSREDFEQGRVRWDKMTPPEWMPHSLQAVEEFISKGYTTPYEKEYIRKDGSRWWALFAATRLNDEEGVEFIIDITERKQVEEALRRSEERYRTLFESIDEGFCVIEMLFDENDMPLDYRFLEINPAFEQQTGLKQAEGKTALQLVPNLEEHWFEIYGKVALTGESLRFENGSQEMNRWFDVYAFRIGQPESRKVAILFKDITERKRIEAEREQILQREQTAREAAENANRIKDEFLAVLSHELRTPLNPILGWTSLLRNGKLDAAKTAYAVETIERNAKLQVQLIEDLLDISRILRGKLSLNVMPVDLGAVIRAALETVRLAAVAKSLQIQTTISPTVGTIAGDAGRLQQVVWNLLSNAVKFTPNGGQIIVTLTIAETHAQIQVTDTGKGIDPEFVPYIFEHFRQEDGATTRKFGGLGLGLAIARQIVELHGGTVQAESPGVGKGATFTVKLPLLRNEDPTMRDEQIHASLTLPALPLSNVQVLVVDDEIDTRELIAFILEQAGASVTSVPSARAALEVLAHLKPDVLVSDVGMPEMDGYMLMQQIRAMSQGLQIPAIALTAYAGESDQNQALAAGFQQHVSKPIDPEMLVAAIAGLIVKDSTAVKIS
ncbi:response regulator [Iningainema sp. BLCCT55]|uniref:Circadian input-output histidine kinase CikA n=2 Tax=Iningainema TaxID=1932705 RepID=A0A8J7CEU4_9CYAN|nr:ATP-binding protein [Iningainema tapete]MBD2773940.1 response regulator [Iningainema tapete BLCC-T55]